MVPLARRGYRPNNVERKVADLNVATYNISTTGVFQMLANPTTGSDMTNRIGRKICLKSVYIRGLIVSEASRSGVAAQLAPQVARMVILIDQQPNGAAPAALDFLKEANALSQLNLDGRDRFKVLVDKQWFIGPYVLNATATTAVAELPNQGYVYKKYKKMNEEVVFSTSTGGIADIQSGCLLAFFIGTNASGTNSDANFIGTFRVRYTDN